MDFHEKERYGIDDFLQIVKILRSPEGCPWDREQDHHSIRNGFLEETYEAVEAIDTEDPVLLQEELGDVLLQVVFHAQLEEEQGRFTFSDVVDGVAKKMVVRHPHVFGTVHAETSAEVLQNWDAIKKRTKAQKTQTDVLRGVSRALPALTRSEKLQKKAAKVGFDWPNAEGALEKVEEELAELRGAMEHGSEQDRWEELGDLLFSVVNAARFLQVEPEQALEQACDKFIARFARMETLAKQESLSLSEASAEEWNKLWESAKKSDGALRKDDGN